MVSYGPMVSLSVPTPPGPGPASHDMHGVHGMPQLAMHAIIVSRGVSRFEPAVRTCCVGLYRKSSGLNFRFACLPVRQGPDSVPRPTAMFAGSTVHMHACMHLAKDRRVAG